MAALTPPGGKGSFLHESGVRSLGIRNAHGSIAVKPLSPHTPGPRRFGVLALALLQFAVFAALPGADAVLEARGFGTVLHIEREAGERCDTGHSHLLCQLTRTLSSGISVPILTDPRLAPEASLRTPTATAGQSRPIPLGGSGPRAPPQS